MSVKVLRAAHCVELGIHFVCVYVCVHVCACVCVCVCVPRLRPIDVEFMKRLGKIVSIVPVIAKADTLTLEERTEFKQRVTHRHTHTGTHTHRHTHTHTHIRTHTLKHTHTGARTHAYALHSQTHTAFKVG